MYRYVPFDKIEKNKWNGTVHYSPNGNIFGYYWYLKAILKEWDAIVEDDYETVLPIITRPLLKEEYYLLPELGPYSVNFLSPQRLDSVFAQADPYHSASLYPINREIPSEYFENQQKNINNHPFLLLDTKEPYHQLKENYSASVIKIIDQERKDHFKIMSGLKPEDIVVNGNIPNHYQNGLMRIMYNALHRGIGFSSAIKNKHTDQIESISFFAISNNRIEEIFEYNKNPDARTILLDLLIRNNGGKPHKISIKKSEGIGENLGFQPDNHRYVQIKKSSTAGIKKVLGMQY
jgi:hypothetical protein